EVPLLGRQAFAWCADDRTVVVGLLQAHVADCSAGRRGLAHLPERLREVLEQRIDPVAPLWAAAAPDDWRESAVGALVPLPKEDRDRLAGLRAAAVWVLPGDPQKSLLKAVLRCRDGADGRAVQGYLADRGLTTDREDAWLSLKRTVDL